MKALIISEANDIIDEFTEYYKTQNYDIIKYRWLMKALDNIEEIAPDLIFINATEYPRHWKIICQYIKVFEKKVKIVLYTANPLSNEEKEKAECLQIDTIVNTIEDLQEVCCIDNICKQPEENSQQQKIINEGSKVSKIEESDKTIQQPTLPEKNNENFVCKFLFSNPENLVLITGKVKSFVDSKLIFSPDNPEDTKNLLVNQIIKKCTLKVDDKINTVDVKIVKNDSQMELLICS